MASTREKNDPSRFCHEQRSLRNTYNHVMWKYKTVPFLSTYPTAGINMPTMRNGYINVNPITEHYIMNNSIAICH